MSKIQPTHRKCGRTTEPVTLTLPTELIPRLADHLKVIGSTRTAYITKPIIADMERHENGSAPHHARR